MIESIPAPPLRVSAPPPPFSVSSPPNPEIVSAADVPNRVSLELLPEIVAIGCPLLPPFASAVDAAQGCPNATGAIRGEHDARLRGACHAASRHGARSHCRLDVLT